jgi:3-hydroxyisobutyrate dehydrogenase-like beta-hydroxyacid dehydrogenase
MLAPFPVALWARRPEALDPYRDSGTTMASSAGSLAAMCQIVCVCVPDETAIDEVMRGADGVLKGLSPGSTLLIHSTVRPEVCRDLAAQASRAGAAVIDAPVSNFSHQPRRHIGEAEQMDKRTATLTAFVGGSREAVEKCRSVLDAVADRVFHLGPVGAGQIGKLINNLMFFAGVAASFDLLSAGQRLDLSPLELASAIQHASGRSAALEAVTDHYDLSDLPESLARFRQDFGHLMAKDTEAVRSVLDDVERLGTSIALLIDIAATFGDPT